MYALNEKGGWLVPSGSTITGSAEIPAFSKFGRGCKFEERHVFGDRCVFGPSCEFVSDSDFGNYCEFDYACGFGICCKFERSCEFDSYCAFGNYCEFGSGCAFGNNCVLGTGCKIGPANTLTGCTVLGLVVKRFMTLANVDGSGRLVLVVLGECGNIKVETGCFCGSVDEFCERAEQEGKHRYVVAIKAMCEIIKIP